VRNFHNLIYQNKTHAGGPSSWPFQDITTPDFSINPLSGQVSLLKQTMKTLREFATRLIAERLKKRKIFSKYPLKKQLVLLKEHGLKSTVVPSTQKCIGVDR